METIKIITYGPFKTQVLITKEVQEFLNENNENLDLTKDLDSDSWYQSWLLKYLDKNKDSIPDDEFGKEFNLIYTNIIQNPEDYQDTEDILEQLEIPQTNLIFDGSKTVFEDLKNNPQKTKFWVRWIVVKR